MGLDLEALARQLASSRGVRHKQDIGAVVARLGVADPTAAVAVGDDAAAIPTDFADGPGYLLLAAEGFMSEFVAAEPYFAGYCGVMVNASDIYAMGGRPLAVVDALWSRDAGAAETMAGGLAAGARAYGIPVVGGHTNARAGQDQLAVAILGRARTLLSGFAARPGDALVVATDLRGGYRQRFSNWDASTGADPGRLRADLELLPGLAEDGLCRAARDISQAGFLGTLLMLLEGSGVGGVMAPARLPRPACVPLHDADARARWWLETFPSYGFALAVEPRHTPAVLARFAARGLAAAVVGTVTEGARVFLADDDDGRRVLAWDFGQTALTGTGPAPRSFPTSPPPCPK